MGVFSSGQWGQTVNLLLFSFGGSNPPAPTKNSSVVMTLEFLFYLEVCKASQGWIRTAAEPTTACGGNREARLGQRSAFSKPCQGAAEKAASATRKTRRIVRREKKPLCNSDDRCQRQKQGGAVGAAASRMRVPPKARCSRWERRPGFLFCAARAIHPHPPKNRNVSKYAAVLFYDTFSCYFCFAHLSEQLR